MTKLLVADFSHWQSVPDWNVLAKTGELAGVIIKITQGIYPDKDADFRMSVIPKTCMLVGGYHWFNPVANPIAQAVAYLTHGSKADFHSCDIEWQKTSVEGIETWNNLSAEERVDAIFAYLDYVRASTGKTPKIYTNLAFFNQFLAKATNVDKLYEFPIWDNSFSGAPVPIPNFAPPLLWQYTDQLILPGIQGKVDGNYFLGNIQELWEWAEFNIEPNNDYHPKVEALQRALGIGVDGKYGLVETTKAVATWQSANGYSNADGKITASQWGQLFNIKSY